MSEYPIDRIVFGSDGKGFYETPVELPPAAWWNADDFLFTYLEAMLNKLINGHTLWEDESLEKLKKAQSLAGEYIRMDCNFSDRNEVGSECLRLLAEIGPNRLWD